MKKLVTYVLIVTGIALIPLTLTRCSEPTGGDTNTNSTTTSSSTTSTTTTTINGKLVVYYRDGYGFSDPQMWCWYTGQDGFDATKVGTTTNIGGYDFVQFTVTVNYTGTLYYKFKDGTGTSGVTWEPLGIEGTANRSQAFTVSATLKTNFAVAYNRRTWTRTGLLSVLSNPSSADEWEAITNVGGANVLGDGTTMFSIFAPNSTGVKVTGEFASPTTWNLNATQDMKLTPDGKYWWKRVTIASPEGMMYKFVLDGSTWTADPNCKAWTWDSGNGIIWTTNYTWTDGSWSRPTLDQLVIYELHVKDFTSDSSSGVASANQGKYAGIAEKLGYLTGLGINAVEFMPTSEFNDAGYSWGYMTQNFFAPESGYASYSGTYPDGTQCDQFKTLIDTCHNSNVAVILDMVYNHIGSDNNSFWSIDSVYYFDYNNDGLVEAGTGEADSTPWGNHFCTWRPMVKKMMYDNVKYFIDVYHVDGFRFDATSYVDHNGLLEVIAALKTDYPNVYFIAEQLPNSSDFKGKLAQWCGVFHDKMKAMLGQDTFEGESYSAGVPNVAKMVYYAKADGCAASPLDTINYFESHDENSVYTELVTYGSRTAAQATNATCLGAVCLFTSLGTPMIMAGEEWLRARVGQDTDESNGKIVWSWQNTSATNIANFYAALIKLRIAHAALRMTASDPLGAGTFRWSIVSSTSSSVWGSLGYPYTLDSSGKVIGYELNVDGSIEANRFVVVLNFGTTDVTESVKFPNSGTWTLICDGTTVNESGISTFVTTANASGGETNYTIPAGMGMIFMQ